VAEKLLADLYVSDRNQLQPLQSVQCQCNRVYWQW